ncbi:MAG: serine/threonine-protein kinase, partial [Planctomycetota bacterium]
MERLGPYTILGELGRGGMGVVYRARHEELGRDVAVKVIAADAQRSPDAAERFKREARAAGALADHPGIVGVHDVGESDGLLYLVMDLIEGRSLEAVADEGDLAPREAAEILEKVARAVHHAHGAGVLHRDLKPGNILLARGAGAAGRAAPFVTDFGLARTSQLDGDSRRLTRTGEMVGTPAFMPPEQARGESLDARADVYALGATLYAALAGRPPFDSDSMHGVLKGLLYDPPPSLRSIVPGTPAALEAIVECCLEKEPEARYATAAALADDLARFLRGEPVQARRRGAMRRTLARLGQRRGTALALAGVVAVAAAGAAVWWWNDRQAATRQQTEAADRSAEARAQRTAAWIDLAASTHAPMSLLEDLWYGRPVAAAEAAAALAAVERACDAHAEAYPASRLAAAWRALARVFAGAAPEPADAPWLEAEWRGADPYAELVEARYWLGRYSRDLILTGFSVGAGTKSRNPFNETDAQRASRAHAVAALERALGAAEFRDAGEAGRLRAFGDGAGALASARHEEAERRLAQAKDEPTFGGLANHLRGFALFHLGREDEAAKSWGTLAERGWLAAVANATGAWITAGDDAQRRGDDPAPFLRRAEALTAAPAGTRLQRAWLVRLRAISRWSLGRWLSRTGGDPFPVWEQALADLAEHDELAPGARDAAALHAGVATQMGRTAVLRGEDGGPWLRDAIRALDSLVRDLPQEPAYRRERGDAWRELAEGLIRGVIPAEDGPAEAAAAIQVALADLTAAITGDPGDALALRLRGTVWLQRQGLQQEADPGAASEALRRALQDLEQSARLAPQLPLSHFDLGRAYRIAAMERRAAGADASALLAKAVDRLQEAVRLDPRQSGTWMQLGHIRLELARESRRLDRPADEHEAAALEAFAAAAKADPARWETHDERGRLLIELSLVRVQRGEDGRELARAAIAAHDAA